MKEKYDKAVMQKAHEVFHVMSKRVSEKVTMFAVGNTNEPIGDSP